MRFFVCDHRRPVARDEAGDWRHICEYTNARGGALLSVCEAGIYSHELEVGSNNVFQLVLRDAPPSGADLDSSTVESAP